MPVTILDLGTQRHNIKVLIFISSLSTDLGWSDSPEQYNVMNGIYDDINISDI